MQSSPIAIDPSDPRWVYVGNDYQLLRSSDGGDTWTDVEPFVAGKTGGRSLVVAPSDGKVLYRVASWTALLERGDDRAATLHPLGPQSQYARLIAVDPRDANSVWIAGYETIEHSTDGGATWQNVAAPYPGWNVQALRLDPTGHTLHVAFQQHGVWELPVN